MKKKKDKKLFSDLEPGDVLVLQKRAKGEPLQSRLVISRVDRDVLFFETRASSPSPRYYFREQFDYTGDDFIVFGWRLL